MAHSNMSAQTRADLFFRDLFVEGADAFRILDGLITNQAEEDQWLDFKHADYIDAPLPSKESIQKKEKKRREDSVKGIWSENLSAFANSGGGVLVWGIDAPRRKAEKRSFPRDATALADHLKILQNDAVDPPVSGVEVQAVLEPGSQSGFVVCLIPNSNFAPHKAIWADREYYMRAGDSNRPMSTAMLRRMFYPHTEPRLIPVLKLTCPQKGDQLQIHISVHLDNQGSASAQQSYLEARVRNANQGFAAYKAACWEERPYSQDGYVCSDIIHPGEKVLFLRNWTSMGSYADITELPESMRCEFKIFTLNGTPLMAEATFARNELTEAAKAQKSIIREARITPQI